MLVTAEKHPESILQLETLLKSKNKQLEALKKITCIMGTVDKECDFIYQALKIVKKVMDTNTDPFLYLRGAERKSSCQPGNYKTLEEFYFYLKKQKKLGRDAIVVDSCTPLANIADKENWGSCIVAPIYHADKDIGYLAILNSSHQTISKDDRLFLRYAGETIGILLQIFQVNSEFATIRTELEQNFNELSAVHSISGAISGDMDVHAILNNALDTLLAQDILNIEAKGGIFLINETTRHLDMVCQRGLDPILIKNEVSIPLGYCLCGIAAENGEIIVSDNCFTDTRHHTQYDGMVPHGHIVLPLKAKGKIIGVLFLYLPVRLQATKRQLKMLKTIANQLAVAVENARLYEQVKHLSLHDPLTGLANRVLLHSRLKDEASRSRRMQESLAVAMVDIDFFKKVNDTYGHTAGDMVLRELAVLLREEFRRCDFIARYGGEEFTLVMPCTDKDQAATTMERIRQSVEKYKFCSGRSKAYDNIRITVSGGIAVEDGVDDSWTTKELIEAADKALYDAKEAGRNRILIAT